MTLSRRQFTSIAVSAAFAGLARNLLSPPATAMVTASGATASGATASGYGPLQSDPNALLDLPEGFSYRVISRLGATMSDGLMVPDRADGMGCFGISDDKVALVRNHELAHWHKTGGAFRENGPRDIDAFDRLDDGTPLPGGTTTLIYNMKTGRVEREYLSLIGTLRNCAGGATPWGSWLTCEENVTRAGDKVQKDHGWIFEVPAQADGIVSPEPIKAMGRFNHEAAAIDPRTGIVYLTEDRNDSLFYRFIPKTPGKLKDGGRLQALSFRNGAPHQDSRNWERRDLGVGEWRDAEWVDLTGTDSPEDDLRLRGHEDGATVFARGEGVHWGDGELYFCCTSGGAARLGQIMRYRPGPDEGTPGEVSAPGRLQLFLESDDPDRFNFGDNLTVAPNGHLFVCEDQYTDTVSNHIRGVTPAGALYDFAHVRLQTEVAGACFSPDGSVLFVNLYQPTRTLAITGPWGFMS